MNSLTFSVVNFEESEPPVWAIVPAIDSILLTDRAAEFERQQQWQPAGGYGGLIPAFYNYGPIVDYFLGKTAGWGTGKNKIPLLACDCGEVGCRPLLAAVVVNDNSVTWQGFEQPYRPEQDCSAFGPFVFERGQYRRALEELAMRLRLDR